MHDNGHFIDHRKRGQYFLAMQMIRTYFNNLVSCNGSRVEIEVGKKENHGTQDSRVVPHRGTNWAALRLTAQIERDAVFSKSYGRG